MLDHIFCEGFFLSNILSLLPSFFVTAQVSMAYGRYFAYKNFCLPGKEL
jgi:hypothetical protein